MMYHSKTEGYLVNLNQFHSVYVSISDHPTTPFRVIAKRHDALSNEYGKVEYVLARYATEQEAINELKYIAQEMNK